jgi:hypothetical protein
MEPFWDHLSQLKKARELDIVLAGAWFAEKVSGRQPKVDEVCDLVEQAGVRLNINRSRLRKRLREASGVSVTRDDVVSITRQKTLDLTSEFGQFLAPATVPVTDTVLVTSSYAGQRPYVVTLVRQINGCRQQDYFDACAVMMRRLVETLAVDAFERRGKLGLILDGNGEVKALSAIVDTLKSGQPFKLSRGMDKTLSKVKDLGDRAAHNRRYCTTSLDIDGVAPDFRCLVAELVAL